MFLKFLSSKEYKPSETNYGDCILIDTGDELIIYDCGSEAHAKRVETYMSNRGYEQAIAVLSHNDADHFNGFPYLIENGLISQFYAQLFLKHKDKIIDLLNDGRVNKNSLGNRITNEYDNIAKLSGQVQLKDAITLGEIIPGINIVGPDKNYAIETVVKHIKNTESNTIDSESTMNAASVQLSVDLNSENALLCGDSSFDAIESKLKDYQVIQLPHHGKPDTAEKIFEAKSKEFLTVYLVSDNTGTSNGGSDDLKKDGKRIKNTIDGDITYPDISHSPFPTRTLGV